MRRSDDYPLSEIFGPEWDGVTVRAGRWLVLPGWRSGFTPGELRALFWDVQRCRTLQAELDQARRDMQAMQEIMQEAERRAAWYRSQLVAESRLGLMLAPLVSS